MTKLIAIVLPLVLMVLLVTDATACSRCKKRSCRSCYVYKPVCCVPPVQPVKIENKVKVLTRLIGFSQPQQSQLSLEEQFEYQAQADETLSLLSTEESPVPMRRFAFQDNLPAYVAKQQSVVQRQSIQYQQTSQTYAGLVEIPVTIKNGEVMTDPVLIDGKPVSNYAPTVQSNVQSVSSSESTHTINIMPQMVSPYQNKMQH